MVTKEDLAQAILELKNSNLEFKASQEKITLDLKLSQEKSDRRLDRVAKLVLSHS